MDDLEPQIDTDAIPVVDAACVDLGEHADDAWNALNDKLHAIAGVRLDSPNTETLGSPSNDDSPVISDSVSPGEAKAKRLQNGVETRKPLRDWRKPFLVALEKSGHIGKSADAAGVKRKCAYRRRLRDAKFAAKWEAALTAHFAERGRLVENAALKRAVKGVKEPIYQGGVLVGYKQRYSDALAAKLLEGYVPERFAPRLKAELSGPGGMPIQTEAKVLSVSQEDLLLVQQLLSGGMLSIAPRSD